LSLLLENFGKLIDRKRRRAALREFEFGQTVGRPWPFGRGTPRTIFYSESEDRLAKRQPIGLGLCPLAFRDWPLPNRNTGFGTISDRGSAQNARNVRSEQLDPFKMPPRRKNTGIVNWVLLPRRDRF